MGEKKLKRKNKKLKIGLPKIPWEKVALFAVLMGLLGVQIYSFFLPKSKFERAKERVIKNPNDFGAHLVLAEELLKNNRLKEGETELEKITKLQAPSSNISNENQVKLEKLWQEKQENDPQDLEILIQKWQKVLEEKPDYRDGWLKMAVYLIKVRKINEAKEALEKAKELDPNYEIIREIEARIEGQR